MNQRRIAFTGHRGLPTATASLVDAAIRAELSGRAASVTGLSCLADGADQVFARAVLDLGGRIEAVVPAARYRRGLPARARPEFDLLLARAGELWAVWDGKPARGYGGTADVVAHARDRGLPVLVIWPDGAHRD